VTLYGRDRRYSIQLWVDGVRHLKSTGTTNRREAETIEREFREELNRKRHQVREASPDMMFTDLAARVLADGSPRPYHLDRLKVLLPYFGEFSIGRISKPSVREYRHKKKQLGATPRCFVPQPHMPPMTGMSPLPASLNMQSTRVGTLSVASRLTTWSYPPSGSARNDTILGRQPRLAARMPTVAVNH